MVNAIKKNEYNNTTEFKVDINEQNSALNLTQWENLEKDYLTNLPGLISDTRDKYEIFINQLDAALKAKEVLAE
jgi:hypothetical protein